MNRKELSKLRVKAGVQIKVIHYRYPKAEILMEANHDRRTMGDLRPERDLRKEGVPVNSNGGLTVVEVHGLGDAVRIGHAYCNLVDTFNRKRGVLIAAGRALKGDQGPIVPPVNVKP